MDVPKVFLWNSNRLNNKERSADDVQGTSDVGIVVHTEIEQLNRMNNCQMVIIKRILLQINCRCIFSNIGKIQTKSIVNKIVNRFCNFMVF